MPNAGKSIPAKLKHDAIIEAILEIRFETSTMTEVLIGRLADHSPWKGFKPKRLPASEIPEPLRQVDKNLRYTPVFELVDEVGHRSVRIGPHVLSYHQLAPYVGWPFFKPELEKAIDGLFEKTGGLTAKRLGFRYVNALTSTIHGIGSVEDLDLKIVVADATLPGNVNLNFTTQVSEDTDCTVRIATRDFMVGALPEATSVVVDVDVYTKEAFKTRDGGLVKRWLEFAHTSEKEQFFRLLTRTTIDTLKES